MTVVSRREKDYLVSIENRATEDFGDACANKDYFYLEA